MANKPKKKNKMSAGKTAESIGCFVVGVVAFAVVVPVLEWIGSHKTESVYIAIVLLVLLFFVAYIDVRIKGKQSNRIRNAIKNGQHIDMTGEQYEQYVASRLSAMGYRQIQMTKASGDHGADIIAIALDGVRCAVQCKYYSKPVGNKAVQEALSGSVYYWCQRAIVITNNDFTRQAIEDADRTGVELISRF